ncbi:MAG TPA: 50S ribosomal protein L6 [Candidatus Woesearchaeota archaeon]|nr:50S ribosomal protein L6 [Candidatus Woesearchaeota archaeon]
MKIENLTQEIEIPEGIQLFIEGKVLRVKGPLGEVSKAFIYPRVKIESNGKTVVLSAKNATKREKRMMLTYTAHIKNLFKGVKEAFVYRLKVCHSHFPVSVSVQKGEISVKNLFGENVPRKLALPSDVEVKLNGDIIEVKGTDIEKVGNCATSLEQLTRISNRDRRIFQDGIYIIEKNGKHV